MKHGLIFFSFFFVAGIMERKTLKRDLIIHKFKIFTWLRCKWCKDFVCGGHYQRWAKKRRKLSSFDATSSLNNDLWQRCINKIYLRVSYETKEKFSSFFLFFSSSSSALFFCVKKEKTAKKIYNNSSDDDDEASRENVVVLKNGKKWRKNAEREEKKNI